MSVNNEQLNLSNLNDLEEGEILMVSCHVKCVIYTK